MLHGLESRGLEPSPSADRRTLVRRATFDLLGLPPTPGETEAFVSDTASGAWERLVERLLASPHYGERWGRHWLDVARYADNKGYVFFEEKTYPWAYTYRDYVVSALNRDLPFDRFLLEQLAADQLSPAPDPSTLAALGFITVGDHLVNNVHDIIDDRIDVVSRGLLGLTAGCARCHDHKFDPVTQADYYGLYGVFRSSTEPLVPPVLRVPRFSEEYEQFELELSLREQRLRGFVAEKHHEIVEGGRRRVAEYLAAAHAAHGQPLTENFMVLADKGDLNPTVILRWRTLLERDTDLRHPVWGPWHACAGLLPGTNFQSLASRALSPLLAREAREGVGDLNPRVREAFAGSAPASMSEVIERYVRLLQRAESGWTNLIAARHASGAAPPAGLPDPADEQLRAFLYGPEAPPDVPGTMDWGFISLLPDRASQGIFQSLITSLEQWMMHGPGAPPRAMVLGEAVTPYEPRIFLRGNPNRPGPQVPRRFFGAFSGGRAPFQHGSGRLELAEAIVDPANPLTARVLVNRVWAHHFGAGLVATPSDFGTRSDPPSNPGLLDYLAEGLIRHGWSLKWLHREILLSATYQQASQDRAAGMARDPENRWLWRMNRRRHDFETLRDSLLAVGGRLDPSLGGPPVGFDAPRRTLYVFLDRMDLPSLYSTFDFPSPSASCPQRAATTVAPQALFLMNNGFMDGVVEGILSRPEIRSARGSSDRIVRLYGLLYGRNPTEAEQRVGGNYLARTGEKAGWGRYVHGLLMANEFVFVD